MLVGFDTTLAYSRLAKACDFIRAGLPAYGLNPDLNCPTETGFIPDCGSIAKLIEGSTGRTFPFFGKPSPLTRAYIAKHTGLSESEIAVVGDRLYTDIALADNSPMCSILVLSGESKAGDIGTMPGTPDPCFPRPFGDDPLPVNAIQQNARRLTGFPGACGRLLFFWAAFGCIAFSPFCPERCGFP